MRISQQYEELIFLKNTINQKLSEQSFQGRKELILWLSKSKMYQKLKSKDNQLIYLDCACKIWLQEKKKLTALGIGDDFFSEVISLEEIEQRYLTVKFAGLRLEQEMPVEYWIQAVEKMLAQRISGIAAFIIFQTETLEREKNLLRLAGLLKELGHNLQALVLLRESVHVYAENEAIRLELAGCWLERGELKEAYACLKEAEHPSENVRGLIRELEEAGYADVQ